LTYSPELTLGSGYLVQSERVFLLFGFKLVLFSSNFFHLDNNFFGKCPLLVFRERFLGLQESFLQEISTFRFLARRLLIPGLSIPQIASFLLKNAHHHNRRSHLTGFCGFDCNFISPGGITRGCSGNFDQTGLSRQMDST
jgi:hypothetical protein